MLYVGGGEMETKNECRCFIQSPFDTFTTHGHKDGDKEHYYYTHKKKKCIKLYANHEISI